MRRAFTVKAFCVGVLALSWAGCAGSQSAVRDGEAGGDGVAGPNAPLVSSRSQLLFEDALKASEAQRKSGRWDYPVLERKFQAALDADSRLAEAEYNLGVLAERQGKLDEAARHYKNALRRKPSLHQAQENLAVLAQNKGDVQGAVGMYQEIIKNNPDDASSRARLAEIYRQNGEQDRAMEMARQSLTKDPKTLGAYKVMMRSYADRKQPSMAKLVALRAMKIDERDPELYQTLGLLLLQENEPEKARAQFRKAVEVQSDYLPAHLVLAKMALKSEDYAGAERHLRTILQSNGKNAEALLNLGVAYKGLGQYDKAMQAYDEAEKVNADLPAIYLNRGIILHRVKDAPERAMELYRKYLALVGEAALPADAPIFNLMKEADAVIQAKAEAKEAEMQAKRLEAAEKTQQEQLKVAEEKEKREKATAPVDTAQVLNEKELESGLPNQAKAAQTPQAPGSKKAAAAAPKKQAPKASPDSTGEPEDGQ